MTNLANTDHLFYSPEEESCCALLIDADNSALLQPDETNTVEDVYRELACRTVSLVSDNEVTTAAHPYKFVLGHTPFHCPLCGSKVHP